VCGPWGVPACGVVPERCHAVGAAVDAHRDTPAWGQRAERTVEGGVVAVPRPLCVATCAVHYCATRGSISPLFYPQLLATKEMTSRHTVGIYKIKKSHIPPTYAVEYGTVHT
jgi:hypothetical protein